MNVQKRNGVSVYCLSAGTTLPEWLGDRGRRNLSKRDESVRRRIELLQEFQMPAASSKLRQSSDGRYIMAAGVYPPRIRCYDVHELSMKFERYLNAECLDMRLLGSDYGKVALLLDDRTVAFHAHYGAHESVRIPTAGRALEYEPSTCEVLVAARGSSVYRINLEEGRFREPWNFHLDSSSNDDVSATCIAVHPRHPLVTVGCDNGTVCLWDARDPDALLKPFLKLDVKTPTQGYGYYDASEHSNPHEITALANDGAGLYTAVGTAGGVVALYDVRSSRPLFVQEHKLGQPIHTVHFHSGSGMILSGDPQLIKIWRYKASSSSSTLKHSGNTMDDEVGTQAASNIHNNISTAANSNDNEMGSILVNIEGSGSKLTHFIVAGDENDPHQQKSGVLLCATDQPKMDSFYVPALGVAPRWCSFLENITEELEERDIQRTTATNATGTTTATDDPQQEAVFENYKFVTRDELDQLGVSNLIGTPLLRGYMHGFFMDVQLYHRVRAVARPFEYEEYQKQKVKERLREKQASRIAPRNANKKGLSKKAAVNPELADRLQRKVVDSKSAKKAEVAQGLLSDDRFGTLFTNPDFAIDEEDDDFKLRNPSGVAKFKRKQNNLDSSDEDEGEDFGNENKADSVDKFSRDFAEEFSDAEMAEDDNDSSDSDEDGIRGGKVRGEAYEAMKRDRSVTEATASKKVSRSKSNVTQKNVNKRTRAAGTAILQEADDFGDVLGFGSGANTGSADGRRQPPPPPQQQQLRRDMTLAERKELEAQAMRDQLQVRSREGGSKEVTFVPRGSQGRANSDKKTSHGDDKDGPQKRNRRGVKELGFKTPFRNKR